VTRLIAFCIFLTALFGASSAVAGTLEEIRSRGILRWGGDMQGGEPYVSQDPSGKLVGFEVELADAIARELGVRAEFVQADWSALVATLERGTFDIAMNGLEVTPARRGRILFSKPYYAFALRLVARTGDTRINADLSRLKGFRVGTLTGSLSEQTLRGHAEVVLYEGVQEPYLDLEHRRIDAVLLDDIIAERYGARPALRVVGDIALGEYAIGIRPDDEPLRKKMDEALEAIAQRGELEKILRKSNIWNDRQKSLFAAPTPLPSSSASSVSGRSPGTGRSTDTSTGPEGTLVTPTSTSPSLTFQHFILFLHGAGMTLLVSCLAMLLAVPCGLFFCLTRLYGPRPASALVHWLVELLRGTPVLLQLYVLYFGLAPIIRLAPLSAAVLGLGLNYAAYESEVQRAAILSVPRGQLEAATVLGMSRNLALRRIVLPQALRVALPGTTNDFIALLKDSSLVSVITVVELTKQMTITAVDVRGWLLPGLLCAGLYFAMSYPLARISARLEARLHRT
jgi:polar amino acid transport system substrate-binding protein